MMPTPPGSGSGFPASAPGYYHPLPSHQMPPHPFPPPNARNHAPSQRNGGPSGSSQQIPIDPSLAMYSDQYYSYQQPQAGPSHSSPSESSESVNSPVVEKAQVSNTRGAKRPAASAGGAAGPSRKKPRKDGEADTPDAVAPSPGADGTPGGEKAKSTRGSRACTVCRRLKMKCVGAEQGPPCKRCQTQGHECVFEESNRGKRSSKKHEILARSLRKMEKTLDTVLRSISNPGITSLASGMVSRSPSPSPQTATTQALLQSPSPPPTGALPPNWAPRYSAVQNKLATLSSAAMAANGGGSPKLHSLPDNALNPLGLLAEASLANRRAQVQAQMSAQNSPVAGVNPVPVLGAAATAGAITGGLMGSNARVESDQDIKVGVANDVYFKPGPMTILPLRRLYIERQVQPEMLSFTTTEEVVELFNIYFDHMNLHCSLLDRDFHTPSLVCSRSPFLLTSICAISSKFYTTKPELHAKLNALAKSLAFSVPEKGYKSVEIVQAYLLLSLWGCGPVERYEQDKTWLLLGMGIRMATDLNLHRKSASARTNGPESAARAKEVHNRERTWMLCFVLDRSFSAQMGKPHSIKEDYIIRNASQWWRAPEASPSDPGIAAYVDLQRILSRSLDFLYSGTSTASGLQTDCDYLLVIKTIETQILAWHNEWSVIRAQSEYRLLIGKFYFNYAMLVVNSFGLQNALERSPVDIGHFFGRCHSSAIACALVVRDELGPQGYLKYSPDSHFVQCSYAVLTLLKLIRPEFQAFLENEVKTVALVKDIADVLENIAANPLHTPALYSTFLRALISAKTEPMAGDAPQNGNNGTAAENVGVVNGNSNPTPMLSFGQPSTGQDGTALGLKMFPAETSTFGGSSPEYLHFNGEMGRVVDVSTFPPTMEPPTTQDDHMGIMSMDNILSTGFWDSVLIPGYSNTLEGLSGGFVYGAGGSGFITPRVGGTPLGSGTNTPITSLPGNPLTQNNINAAFDVTPIGVDSAKTAM